jgi:DNA-binding MarR family transcriptional regulator
MDGPARGSSWTFLTNHARILIMIARDPGIRLREVAAACEITERTAQGVVADLEAAGYLTHTRNGRRNLYLIATGTRFRHIAEADHEIAGLLTLINDWSDTAQPQQPNPREHTAATDTGTETARPTAEGTQAPSRPADGR